MTSPNEREMVRQRREGGGEWRERDAALAIYFVIFLSVFPSFFLAACLDWLNYGLSKLRRKKNQATEEEEAGEETTMIRINWKH